MRKGKNERKGKKIPKREEKKWENNGGYEASYPKNKWGKKRRVDYMDLFMAGYLSAHSRRFVKAATN